MIKSTLDLRRVVVVIPALAAVMAAMLAAFMAVPMGLCSTGGSSD